ncbi:MAG: hypothetical protein JWN34_1253, partial [Bryobacterales bacterium]|nr:hypothetical protein [Bryobacterales bacterium]
MSTFAPTVRRLAPGTRIEAIDVLRGLVIIIMALDHVRDYFHESGWAYDPLDPRFTTPLLYLTRWITNFCAPTFVLLAGVSAWLQAAKGKDTKVLSGFLLKRGLWIVALELTVISFAWSFSIPLLPFLQVMWAIGWSMVVLAGLVWLPRVVVLSLGIAVITLHNLLDPIRSQSFGVFAPVWIMLHDPGPLLRNGRPAALVLYPLLPWAGLMAFGYGLGAAFLSPKKDRILACLGAGMIALFIVLRLLNGYGDPIPWSVQTDAVRSLMAFFRLQKYPPSLMFICATVGPALLTVVAFERLRGPVAA